MIRRAVLMAGLVATATAAQAQQITVETLDTEAGPQIVIVPQQPEIFTLQRDLGTVTSEVVNTAIRAEGAFLRGLDKLNGDVVDLELANGARAEFGQLRIEMAECRYPEDNATGEAYAFLTIRHGSDMAEPVFQGWMIASSPALSALDDARYDLWVMRCKTPPPVETPSD